jgi:hypothetical protein
MPGRRLALVALAGGLAVVVASQHLAPIAGPPLYDGVVVEDPYKWLSPPTGYSGGAQSASASGAVQGGQNPNLAVGTTEQPPQAQVFAGQGYLVMPPGTTTINVSIQPVEPEGQPVDGVIAGNVYRFSLTSQDGRAITGDPTGGVTIVMRGPASLPTAKIERFSGGSWTPLRTDPAGSPHMFTAVVTDFGDFALVAPPGWTPAPPGPAAPVQVGPVPPQATAAAGQGGSASSVPSGPPVLLILGIVAGLALLSIGGVVVWFRRRVPAPVRARTTPRPPHSRSAASRRPSSKRRRR